MADPPPDRAAGVAPAISRMVKLAREQGELSQRELAIAIGVTEKTIRAFETFRVPRPQRRRAIAAALGLPANYFEPTSAGDPPTRAELEHQELRELLEAVIDEQRRQRRILDRLLAEGRRLQRGNG